MAAKVRVVVILIAVAGVICNDGLVSQQDGPQPRVMDKAKAAQDFTLYVGNVVRVLLALGNADLIILAIPFPGLPRCIGQRFVHQYALLSLMR